MSSSNLVIAVKPGNGGNLGRNSLDELSLEARNRIRRDIYSLKEMPGWNVNANFLRQVKIKIPNPYERGASRFPQEGIAIVIAFPSNYPTQPFKVYTNKPFPNPIVVSLPQSRRRTARQISALSLSLTHEVCISTLTEDEWRPEYRLGPILMQVWAALFDEAMFDPGLASDRETDQTDVVDRIHPLETETEQGDQIPDWTLPLSIPVKPVTAKLNSTPYPMHLTNSKSDQVPFEDMREEALKSSLFFLARVAKKNKSCAYVTVGNATRYARGGIIYDDQQQWTRGDIVVVSFCPRYFKKLIVSDELTKEFQHSKHEHTSGSNTTKTSVSSFKKVTQKVTQFTQLTQNSFNVFGDDDTSDETDDEASDNDDHRSTQKQPVIDLLCLANRQHLLVLGFLPAENSVRLSMTCRQLSHVAHDETLWRVHLRREFPHSSLIGPSEECYKHEKHGICVLQCGYTCNGIAYAATVLGYTMDYTINPRTGCVDYVRVDAVRSATVVRKHHADSAWLPLFLTPDHFIRGSNDFEKAILRLSSPRTHFKPGMILEVLPKILNTMIVNICDKGVHGSEHALEQFSMVHRLFQACVEYYPTLQKIVRKRVEQFIKDPLARRKPSVSTQPATSRRFGAGTGSGAGSNSRNWREREGRRLPQPSLKTDRASSPTGCSSLGEFILLLSVCAGEWDSERKCIVTLSKCASKEAGIAKATTAAKSLWLAAAIPIIREALDRNMLWACKAEPNDAKPEMNVIGTGPDAERLKRTWEATKVSNRLFMFHVLVLLKIAPRAHDTSAPTSNASLEQETPAWATRRPSDQFFGSPPVHVRQFCTQHIQKILAVDDWAGYFGMLHLRIPSPAQFTDMIKKAVHNSLQKGYHSKDTDFSRIHRNGVSRLLKCGESYRVESTVRKVRLELGSDSSMILCGACMLYQDTRFYQTVCFMNRNGANGAVWHSGDTQVDGKSHHTICVDLSRLPASVNRLFFTLCCCGGSSLRDFQNPVIRLADEEDSSGANLCEYTLASAGTAATAVMACLSKEGHLGWQVRALHCTSQRRCCGDYGDIKRHIAQIRDV